VPLPGLPPNTDSLALPKEASENAFGEPGRRIALMPASGLRRDELVSIAAWDEGPEAFKNMWSVLVAEAARRHGWADISDQAISACTSILYR